METCWRSAGESTALGWVEAPAPVASVVAAGAVAGCVGAHAAMGLGAIAVVGVGSAAVLFVAGVARRGTLGDLFAAVASCAALGAGGVDGLGLSSPLAPFVAQAPGQSALLGLRVGLCLLAVVRLGRRWPVLAGIALMILASLAAQGLVLAIAGGVPVIIRWGARSARRAPLPRVALVVVLGGLVGLSPPPHARAERRFDSPREETLYWRARRNPFRAHAAALEWAKRERHPGEGYVALAEIDLDLGHVDKARRVLTKIERDGESDAVRARGRELLARASEP